MAVYLGSNKIEVNIDGIVYDVNFYASTVNNAFLISSDDYMLVDIDGKYLIAREDE